MLLLQLLVRHTTAALSRKTLITIVFTARSSSVHYVDIPLHHFTSGHLKYSTLRTSAHHLGKVAKVVQRLRGLCKLRQDLNYQIEISKLIHYKGNSNMDIVT